MEHILPAERQSPFSIPFLLMTDDRYSSAPFVYRSGEEFQQAPHQHNFDFSAWMTRSAHHVGGADIELTSQQWERLPAFLQGWLYFGFLGLILDLNPEEIDLSNFPSWWKDFITEADTDSSSAEQSFFRITTHHLPIHVMKWANNDSSQPSPHWHLASSIAFTVRRNLERMLQGDISGPSAGLRRQIRLILLSVALLECALDIGHRYRELGENPWRGDQDHESRHTVLAELMREAYWCPRAVEMLQQSFDVEMQSLLFALGTTRARPGQHEACTAMVCQRTRAVPGQFKVKHVHEGCRCEMLRIEEERLVELLKTQKVPVLMLVRDAATKSFRLEITGTTDVTPYVTISHVWADGMGNPDANAIPSCQADGLFAVLRSMRTSLSTVLARWNSDDTWQSWHEKLTSLGHSHLPPRPEELEPKGDNRSLPFWLDTLCIPVNKTHGKWRTYCINQMNPIYRNALATLVLDADLRTLPADTRPEHVLARLLLSDWRQRLWTYQEGALSRELYVIGSGSCTWPLKALIGLHKGRTIPHNMVWTECPQKIHYRLNRMVLNDDLKDPEAWHGTGMAVQRLLCALSDRSTSREGDESIVIASALQLDTTLLGSLKGQDERMEQVMRQLGEYVPMNIIFARGERVAKEGLSWLPVSILAPRGVHHELAVVTDPWTGGVRPLTGTLTGRGLEATMPYVDLGTTLKSGIHPFVSRPTAGSAGRFAYVRIEARAGLTFLVDLCEPLCSSDGAVSFDELLGEHCALLLQNNILGRVMWALLVCYEQTPLGVTMLNEPGEYKAKPLALAKLFPVERCDGLAMLPFPMAKWLLI